MVKGNVVKTYKDWNNPIKFDGWVELVEHQAAKDELILNDKYGHKLRGKPPFVFEEVKHHKPDFPDMEELVWYEGKKCIVSGVDERADEILISLPSGAIQKLTYPFPIKTHYHPQHYEISYKGEYLGYIQLVRDRHNYIHVRDNDFNFLKLKREHTEIKTYKYEPRTVLWTGQRWLVKPLVQAFPSQLDGEVWFSNVGQCEDLVFSRGICTFTINGTNYEEKFDSTKFFIKSDKLAHKVVSFYLTTDGAYPSYSEEWDKHRYEEE